MRLPSTAPTLIAIVLLASNCSATAAGLSPAASPTGTTATPLALQPSDGEQRVRRPTPGALSSITVPFILKVDERNGHAEDFVLLTEDIPPGQAIPAHFHPHSEEILFIHAGHGTAWLNGREAKLGPGTIIFMPRNTGARLNDGTEPISLVAIFSRQGFDKFLRGRFGARGRGRQAPQRGGLSSNPGPAQGRGDPREEVAWSCASQNVCF